MGAIEFWNTRTDTHLQARLKQADKLVEALKEADQHLDFFVHVEKRYTESGKEMVAFDKCAEIRAAHAVIKASLKDPTIESGEK